ncbi:TetR/AcrR family transcriptional regulator [Paenibacillus sp. H1-7]|uniref:TetR/AcrR family transcriptional regulator n=1 Tax=Paenibacillus sp. H1-7 TaxID=2282849 RepID=UPI001EF8CAD1|nr:TetR/AcrR family transcriptional regulator [Paenibacillus sp. H1-7]ULL15635.1 TetR/AcrR family transcriptional regulator [Paenibacillus sp. H1-7]
MSTHKPKQDPRITRTHQLLQDALLDLIRERGFDKLTVQQIAERATLNRATFYLHYRDKHDLLQQGMDEVLQQLVNNIRSQTESERVDFRKDKPHPTFIRMFEHIQQHSKYYQVILAEQKIPHFMTRMTEVLSDFASEGISAVEAESEAYHLTVPKEMAVRYAASAFLGVIIWWLEQDMPYSPKYMAANLMKLVIKGPYLNSPFQ